MNIAYLDMNHSDELDFDPSLSYEDRAEIIRNHDATEIMTIQEFTEKFNDEQISDLGYVAMSPESREFLYVTMIDGKTYLVWGYNDDTTDEGKYSYFTVENLFGVKVLGSLDGYNGVPSKDDIRNALNKK